MKMIAVITSFLTLSTSFVLSLSAGSCNQVQNGSDSSASSVQRTGTGMETMTAAPGAGKFKYDLSHPTAIYSLPKQLTEVSGIRFHPKDEVHIYAEQDEKGRLYWLKPGDKEAEYYDFGKDGDYEDLAFVGKQAVFLKSNGTLYGFDFAPASDQKNAPVAGPLQEWKDLVPKGEYEGLFADSTKNQLYMLCKDCKNEDHKKSVSVYLLGYNADQWVKQAVYQIDIAGINSLIDQKGHHKGKKGKKDKKMAFKPSALCQDPVTHEWYILSSVNKMLVILGPDWQLRAVHTLSPELYPQPEGICFDKRHQLYISNEGQRPGGATLLRFAPREGK